MKKFFFNLQSVLDHRLLLEEREQEKLLKLQQAQAAAEAERQQLQEEIHLRRQQMAHPEPGEIKVGEMLQTARYVEKLEGIAAAVSQRIAKLEDEKRLQAERLIEARRKREVLDNLKEKSLVQHEREVQTMEQKLLDELTAVKFAHRGGQNLPAEEP